MITKDIGWLIAGTIFAIMILSLIFIAVSPESFDIFALAVFIYLLIVGIWMFSQKKKIPNWIKYPVIIIGALGFIVDGYIILKTFILN